MMASDEAWLSDEQKEALRDAAERIIHRRARGVRTGGVVTRNDWTDLERDINGARNDLRSAEHVLEKARGSFLVAQEAYERAMRGVQARKARLAELTGEE